MKDNNVVINHVLSKEMPVKNIIAVCKGLEKKYKGCKVHFDVNAHTIYVKEGD